jgi:hypothetical protein
MRKEGKGENKTEKTGGGGLGLSELESVVAAVSEAGRSVDADGACYHTEHQYQAESWGDLPRPVIFPYG